MVPFSEAKTVWADLPGNWRILFKWYGREFHDLFPLGEQGVGTTLYLSIAETPLADRTMPRSVKEDSRKPQRGFPVTGTPHPPIRKLERRQAITWRRQTTVQRTNENMEEYVHHLHTYLMDDQKVQTGLTCRQELRGDETASRQWHDATCPTCPTCWTMRTYGIPANGRQPASYQEAYCAEEIYVRGNRSHQCPRTHTETGLYCRQHEAINFPKAFHRPVPTKHPATQT